jgi:hypothetical protein
MYDENLHNIRIYFTNSHVHVLLYAYNCVIITYNLPGVKVINTYLKGSLLNASEFTGS